VGVSSTRVVVASRLGRGVGPGHEAEGCLHEADWLFAGGDLGGPDFLVSAASVATKVHADRPVEWRFAFVMMGGPGLFAFKLAGEATGFGEPATALPAAIERFALFILAGGAGVPKQLQARRLALGKPQPPSTGSNVSDGPVTDSQVPGDLALTCAAREQSADGADLTI